VVRLGEQRPAVAGETLEHPVVPQGQLVVERLGEQPLDRRAQLPVAAGSGDGGAVHVLADVEGLVVHPDRAAE
jgi:hypothetical protein